MMQFTALAADVCLFVCLFVCFYLSFFLLRNQDKDIFSVCSDASFRSLFWRIWNLIGASFCKEGPPIDDPGCSRFSPSSFFWVEWGGLEGRGGEGGGIGGHGSAK